MDYAVQVTGHCANEKLVYLQRIVKMTGGSFRGWTSGPDITMVTIAFRSGMKWARFNTLWKIIKQDFF